VTRWRNLQTGPAVGPCAADERLTWRLRLLQMGALLRRTLRRFVARGTKRAVSPKNQAMQAAENSTSSSSKLTTASIRTSPGGEKYLKIRLDDSGTML